ncbi:hypothetical protein COOONC_12768 [Cooperia oncophora]
MVFSPSAARTIVSNCACSANDAPDDMIIGMCSQRNNVAIIHNAAFHQARPIDYPEEYIRRLLPISFHKFEDIDPYEVYMEYLFEPPVVQPTGTEDGETSQCGASTSSPADSVSPSESVSVEANECSGNMGESSDDDDPLHIDDELQTNISPLPVPSCIMGYAGRLYDPLKILWLKLRKLGCIVDAVQVKPTRRKLKCNVDRCIFKGGPFESIQLSCTLPPNVELAIRWICICVSDISRQNDYIIKFINLLEKGKGGTLPPTQIASREQLISFPFRVCNRHFSTEPDEGIPAVPKYHLPGKLPISREDMLSKLRRRYIFLSELGYEDLEIDKLEPNGVLPRPSDAPLSCAVPGWFCCYLIGPSRNTEEQVELKKNG